MAGTFIISFDCEGKWGMADHLSPSDHAALTDRSLDQVYCDLAAMLDRYAAPATFAFVMALLLDQDERDEFAELLRPTHEGDDWMGHVVREQARGPLGWFQPSTFDHVSKSGLHETACHGFSHRSLGEGEISVEAARKDIGAAIAVAERKQVTLETMVFPRNRVGNLATLKEMGFIGYRTRKTRHSLLPTKLADLVEEFDMSASAQARDGPSALGLVPIPHGHFFNWRHGKRRLVPPAITVRRWTAMIDDAAASDGVAHLWMHPHNFITGPGTWGPFEKVLRHAADLRDAGKLSILTQADYCRAIENG